MTHNTARIIRRDYANRTLKTFVDHNQIAIGAFGCGGCGSNHQYQVAAGIAARQDQLTLIKYLGDIEYPDSGVPLDTHQAQQKFAQYVSNVYKDNLVYDCVPGNHEGECYGSGPKSLQHALDKENFLQKTIQEDSTPININEDEPSTLKKYWMPDRYYLEEVYHHDPQTDQNYPLVLILHLDSSLLPGDTQQQAWLKNLSTQLSSDYYQQFKQWVLAQHHSVFLSPDKRGRSKKEHPKYPHNKPFTGNHHRVVGCMLQACGIQLNNWILLAAHIHTTAILDTIKHPNLPKLQAVFGGGGSADNKADYKTMIPGLTYTNSGYGYGCLTILENGDFKIQYYDCTSIDLNTYLQSRPIQQFEKQYTAQGAVKHTSRHDFNPLASQLNPKLFKNTPNAQKISQILLNYVKHASLVDWRMLTWSIVALSDWEDDVENNFITMQLFRGLLKINDADNLKPHRQIDNPLQLIKKQLACIIKQIEFFFDQYLNPHYQGWYTTFFCQLAFWHQSLTEIKRSLSASERLSHHLSISTHFEEGEQTLSTDDITFLYAQLEEWLTGFTQSETTMENDESTNTEESYDSQVEQQQIKPPSSFNEFNAPTRDKRTLSHLAVDDSLLATTLDAYINKPDELGQYCIDACKEGLTRRFGEVWNAYILSMAYYNEFAQSYIMSALLALDPTQALSSLFHSQPTSWLSYMLEAQLIYCYQLDHYKDDTERLFSTQLDVHLQALDNYEQQGLILRHLILNQPPYWGHLLETRSHFRLAHHPIICEQTREWLTWDKEQWWQIIAAQYIDRLTQALPTSNSCLYRFYHRFWSKPDSSPETMMYQNYFLMLQQIYDQQPKDLLEEQMKAYLHQQLAEQKDHFWYQPLFDLTEWLLTFNYPEDVDRKWQIIQNQWPDSWSPEPDKPNDTPEVNLYTDDNDLNASLLLSVNQR